MTVRIEVGLEFRSGAVRSYCLGDRFLLTEGFITSDDDFMIS